MQVYSMFVTFLLFSFKCNLKRFLSVIKTHCIYFRLQEATCIRPYCHTFYWLKYVYTQKKKWYRTNQINSLSNSFQQRKKKTRYEFTIRLQICKGRLFLLQGSSTSKSYFKARKIRLKVYLYCINVIDSNKKGIVSC